ncbi:guanylyl and adenylyl cyclase family member, partial [Volvox carteri f. nagariensis]
EERQRSEQLLHQMIPRHIADALRRGERVNAEIYPEATILFSDVVNFTTIAAGSTAMEVCTMLDSLYNEFDELIDKYPSLYKLSNVPSTPLSRSPAPRPLSHARIPDPSGDPNLDLDLVGSRRVTTNMGAPIQIRVGIHTGSVVGGVVGRKMPRFHLFGDTGGASRMESHGLAGAVHISAASRALITNPAKYLITERGEIAVKGKGLM